MCVLRGGGGDVAGGALRLYGMSNDKFYSSIADLAVGL